LYGFGGLLLLLATFPWKNTLKLAKTEAVGAAIFLGLSSSLLFASARAYYSIEISLFQAYRQEERLFQEVLARRGVDVISAVSSDFEGTVVLVLGESTSRHHMGIYGYLRDTTPRLSSRRSELVVFEDVVSPHSHTVPALMPALHSVNPLEQNVPPDAVIDIVSLARSAGFYTEWLSNQNEFGIWDNAVSVIAKAADETHFISSTLGRSLVRTKLDGELLPRLRASMEQNEINKQLIVLHMFAAHSPYCGNYPSQFGLFVDGFDKAFWGTATPRPSVNCYDNSILYIDHILGEILDLAEGARQPVAVLYFSDHGEAPLLGTGHESSRYSSYHVEIPLVFWSNQAFQEKYPTVWRSADRNRGVPYGTREIYHSIAHLMRAVSYTHLTLPTTPYV
jgi:heptose-I-phosphate ethanolaminephosphotransferase